MRFAVAVLLCSALAQAQARPFEVQLPKNYNPAKAAPLLVVLHCYGCTSAYTLEHFHVTETAGAAGYLVVAPDGNSDPRGRRFWNATAACCDFQHSGVDDVAYLRGLIASVRARYKVDRVYLFGFSNGGFMAHRLACEMPSEITAAVSLAGAAPGPGETCKPDHAVSVLEIHGDVDNIVPFAGGVFGPAGALPQLAQFPSARQAMQDWARRDGCKAEPRTAAPVDLNEGIPGAETSVEKWPCAKGAVELWTMHGMPHAASVSPNFMKLIFDFFARARR